MKNDTSRNQILTIEQIVSQSPTWDSDVAARAMVGDQHAVHHERADDREGEVSHRQPSRGGEKERGVENEQKLSGANAMVFLHVEKHGTDAAETRGMAEQSHRPDADQYRQPVLVERGRARGVGTDRDVRTAYRPFPKPDVSTGSSGVPARRNAAIARMGDCTSRPRARIHASSRWVLR